MLILLYLIFSGNKWGVFMKLTYYGTSAAEGVPALFCDCDVCRYSRKAGQKNIRTRSQTLIGDELLIDFPPDTLQHTLYQGLPLDKIHNLIITHKHPDHLYLEDISMRAKGYAYPDDIPPLNIYGSMPSIDAVCSYLLRKDLLKSGRWNLYETEPFISRQIGSFNVIPYKANHDFSTKPYIYDISDGQKRMLYASDTGIFLAETWEFLEKHNPYFNLISLECTLGISQNKRSYHMNLDDCVFVTNRLKELGCADQNTILVLQHFSHNCAASYDKLVPIAQKLGFIVAYDSLTIEF